MAVVNVFQFEAAQL